MNSDLILAVVAIVCLAVAYVQSRRADALVVQLLERDDEQRDSRAELVQVFLDEQLRQEQRHEAERLSWRDERGELLNAVLVTKEREPTFAPGWDSGPAPKLYHTEQDEIDEARSRVAQQIEQQLAVRIPLAPDLAGDVAT